MSETQGQKFERSLTGRQDFIRGDGTLAGAGKDTIVASAGALPPGTYEYIIPVAGGQSVIFANKPATVTGACTVTVVPCLADGSSKNTVPLARVLTLAAGVLNEDAVAVPSGVQALRVTVFVPGAGLLDFTGGVFEYRSGGAPPSARAVTLLPSASRTTTYTSPDLVLTVERFLQLILDMTVVGTGSVTVTINGKDPASGKYYLLLAGAAVITNVTNVYRVGPGLVAAANAVANDALPAVIQIVVTANNANPATYSVGLNFAT